MEEIIIKLAESLINARRLTGELDDKSYWINKASRETDFIPANGDWISIEVTLFKIEVSVHHKEYGGAKYWKNGVWSNDAFNIEYPLHEKMIADRKKYNL